MRKIIHIDMDCFFAAVEILDKPQFAQKPLAVGGQPGQRGVIATCNYPAREFGVRSAMSSARALQLCPTLTIVHPNFARYKQISKAIQQIFQQYTDLIEPLSLDEAYLDVSDCKLCQGSATWMAQAIRQQILQQFGLTASAGIAPNKFLAKIASDWEKPNGQYVVLPEQIDAFVAALPVKKLFGVGPATAEKLQQMGIVSCADLRQQDLLQLVQRFGKFGERLYQLARGIDDRPVNPHRERKSLSVEHTYHHDLPDLLACETALPALQAEFEQRWQRIGAPEFRKVFVKIKFSDFSRTTVEMVATTLTLPLLTELLQQGWQRQQRPVRLLGLGVRMQPEASQQLRLF